MPHEAQRKRLPTSHVPTPLASTKSGSIMALEPSHCLAGRCHGEGDISFYDELGKLLGISAGIRLATTTVTLVQSSRRTVHHESSKLRAAC